MKQVLRCFFVLSLLCLTPQVVEAACWDCDDNDDTCVSANGSGRSSCTSIQNCQLECLNTCSTSGSQCTGSCTEPCTEPDQRVQFEFIPNGGTSLAFHPTPTEREDLRPEAAEGCSDEEDDGSKIEAEQNAVGL